MLLYEALTGARAFPGATASEVRARVLAGQPPQPRSVCPSIPAPLEAVCRRAMAANPADRHPTAEDFSKALRRAVRPTPWPRVVAIPAGLVVLLIGGLAIGGYALSHWSDADPAGADETVPTEGATSPQVEPATPPQAASVNPPGVATLTPTHTLTGHKGPVGVLRFTPDGETLYTSDWWAVLRRWDARTWKPLSQDVGADWPDQRLTSDLAVTADGRRAICLYSGRLQEVDLATGAVVRTFTPPLTAPHGRNQQVVLSPDGRWLAAGDDDVVRLWDFATGAVAWSDPEAARNKSRALAFAPSGERLLVANRFGPATLYTPDSPRASRLPAHWNSLRAAAFFPDGKRAVLAGDDRVVRVWDVSASPPKVVHVLSGPRPSVQAVAVARGGRYVLAVGDDRVLFGWDADTGKQAFATDAGGGIQGVAVGLDGAIAVTGHKDGSVRVWALP